VAGKISLKAAARRAGVKEGNVYARAREVSEDGAPLIRFERRTSGRARSVVVYEEFLEDLAALPCRGPGCGQSAINASEHCSSACASRKYPKQTVACPQCGDDVELEGHVTKDGERHFCTPRCSTAWHWEHAPQTFPQSERRGEVVTCACGRTERYLSPAHLHVKGCHHCAGELRRRWWASPAGDAEREHTSTRTNAYWDRVYAKLDSVKQARGVLVTADVRAALGGVSIATVTRHYVGSRALLTVEPEIIYGRRFLLYTAPREVKLLQRLRATGPAWNTWLDYDWMLCRVRAAGSYQALLEKGHTPQEVEGAIRRQLAAARRLLGAYRGAASGALAPAAGKHRQRQLSLEQEEAIREHHAADKSIRRIAYIVGVPRGRVERFLASELVSIAP
jgi:transposase